MQILKRVDVFPKFNQDFEKEARDRTLFGGLLSFMSLLCISLLVFSELRYFFTTQTHHEIFVDGNSVSEPLPDDQNARSGGGGFFGSQQQDSNALQIKLNITFFEVPCDLMSADAIDSFGDYIPGMERATTKRSISRATGEMAAEPHQHLSATGDADKHHAANPNGLPPDTPADKKNEKRPGCWSCYGAELQPDDCCNSCEDVRQAYSRKGWSFSPSDMSITQCAKERLRRALSLKAHEGCNIVVDVKASRVQGSLHLIPGRAFSHLGQHLHDLGGEEIKSLNLSHRVESLSFGQDFPGIKSPLNGVIGRGSDKVEEDHFGQQQQQQHVSATGGGAGNSGGDGSSKKQAEHPWGGGKFSYYIKIVPTQFTDTSGYEIDTNEYAVTSHYSASAGSPQVGGAIPGIFFQYDITPLVNRITQSRPYASVVHLLLTLCSICGGIFTVAGLVDAVFYHTTERLRKGQLGKLS